MRPNFVRRNFGCIILLIGILCLSTVSAGLVPDFTSARSSVTSPQTIIGSFTNSHKPVPLRYEYGECYHESGKGVVCKESGIKLPYYNRFQTGNFTLSQGYIVETNTTLISFGGKFGRFGRKAFDTDSIGDLRDGYSIQGKFRGRVNFDYNPTSYVQYRMAME